MKTAIAWFIHNPVASNLFMGAIIIAGFLSLLRMKLEIFPETAVDTVKVDVEYPGATPYEVEDGICIAIEEAIQDLNGIKEVVSSSSEGLGRVYIEADSGKDVRELLDDVKVRVDAITTFPEDAERPIIEEITIKNQVLSIAVSSDSDEKSLRRIVDQVRDELLAYEYQPTYSNPIEGIFVKALNVIQGTPKITQVSLASVRPYEIAIEVSEKELRRYNLTFDEVATAVRNSSLDVPGGAIKTNAGEILLRTVGQAYTGKEFEDLVLISTEDGGRITLGQVATVIDGFDESNIRATFDSKRAGVVNVFRTGDQKALAVAEVAKAYVQEAQSRMPQGVSLEVWKDDSVYLEERIDLLVRNALQGLVLVLICLALFLRINVALWVTLGIPISFLGAFIIMSLIGVSINMISLFALILVLGIVVDDAIVVGESVYTHSERYGSGTKSALSGTMQVAVPVTFSILTTIAAFWPMLGIPGVAGKIWGVIPMTVIPALIFSMIESKLILPSHLSHLKTDAPQGPTESLSGLWNWVRGFFSNGLDLFIRRIYRKMIFWATQYRYATLALFIFLLASSVGLVSSGLIRFVFFPVVPADFVIARLEMPLGTSFEQTQKGVRQIEEAALRLRDELRAVSGNSESGFSHIMATAGDQPFTGAFELNLNSGQSHLGEVTVELKPARTRKISSAEVERRWRDLTGEVPGAVALGFTSKLQDVGDPIDIQFTGRNFEDLKKIAVLTKEQLKTYQGTFDISDNFREGKREIQLDIKESAEVLGVNLSDLGRQVRQAFYGEEAQRIQRGRDEIKVMVRYPLEERQSLENLQELRIRTGSESAIPFSQVAEAKFGRGFSTITRVDRQRAINVTADVDNTIGNSREILGNLEKEFFPKLLKDYPDVAYTLEGQSGEQRDTIGGLAVGAIFAFFAIYALMAIPFKSYAKPIIMMSAIPFSLVGAIAGHMLLGMPISMLSICGMVALTGVVVNDGLVLVDHINKNVWKGLPVLMSVRKAGVARFRAILLTSLTTYVGLVPLLSETSTQAQFLKPMATSLAYGVLFATMLNLILVPCVYLILQDIMGFVRRLLGIDKQNGRQLQKDLELGKELSVH